MTFEQKLMVTAVLSAGATAMTFTRRWKNEEKDAGCGIVGWTIVIFIFMWA